MTIGDVKWYTWLSTNMEVLSLEQTPHSKSMNIAPILEIVNQLEFLAYIKNIKRHTYPIEGIIQTW